MIRVTQDNFDRIVMQSNLLTVLFFTTATCGPCKSMKPWLERIEREGQGQVQVVEIDSNQSPEIAQRFDVRMSPTTIAIRQGRVLGVIQGKPPAIQRMYGFVGQYL